MTAPDTASDATSSEGTVIVAESLLPDSLVTVSLTVYVPASP